jgi:hypothetical protein
VAERSGEGGRARARPFTVDVGLLVSSRTDADHARELGLDVVAYSVCCRGS